MAQQSSQNNDQTLKLFETKKVLDVSCTVIDDSKFVMVCMDRAYFNDISAKNVKIINANLSGLEIEGAQLGGAYIHNIGMPPKGHPMYHPDAKQLGLKFEDCALNDSTVTNCDLSNVAITDCNLNGMTINGIPVNELLQKYKNG